MPLKQKEKEGGSSSSYTTTQNSYWSALTVGVASLYRIRKATSECRSCLRRYYGCFRAAEAAAKAAVCCVTALSWCLLLLVFSLKLQPQLSLLLIPCQYGRGGQLPLVLPTGLGKMPPLPASGLLLKDTLSEPLGACRPVPALPYPPQFHQGKIRRGRSWYQAHWADPPRWAFGDRAFAPATDRLRGVFEALRRKPDMHGVPNAFVSTPMSKVNLAFHRVRISKGTGIQSKAFFLFFSMYKSAMRQNIL